MKGCRLRVLAGAAVSLTVTMPEVAAAQATANTRGPLITAREASVLGAGLASSLVLMGLDARISTQVRESALQGNTTVRHILNLGDVAGDPGTLVAGAGLWLSGRLRHDRTQQLVGVRSLESVMATGAITIGLKMIAGRARPDRSPLAPRDFRFGRGFGDRSEFQSFPSGHTTAAFAFASAVDAELNAIAPKHPRWIVPLLYGVATATAASRVYRDRHWTSDVVLGAAIGYVGGRAVVRWHGDRR